MISQQVGSCQPFRWQWQNPPWILIAYVVFAVLTIVLQESINFAPDFHALIVPYTGWAGLGVYPYTIVFVVMAMFTPAKEIASWVARMLVLGAAIHMWDVYDLYDHTWGSRVGREDFGNPYLMYSPWRPLITMVIPLFWAALLNSPSMKRWGRNGIQSVAGE